MIVSSNLIAALGAVRSALENSPLDEQIEFANKIVSIIRSNQARSTQVAKTNFQLRDLVVFRGRAGERLVGVISKLNPTRALIQVKDTTLSVPYSSLRHWSIQDAAEVSQRLIGLGS